MPECLKCESKCKITESYPVWNILDIQEPEYICYQCKPQKLGVKFAKISDYEFVKRVKDHETRM